MLSPKTRRTSAAPGSRVASGPGRRLPGAYRGAARAGRGEPGTVSRPAMNEVTDTLTGRVHLVPTPCRATLVATRAPCAQKNRVLRMQQCREGWHLEPEPEPLAVEEPRLDVDASGAEQDEPSSRRIPSPRHRQDVPDLPPVPMARVARSASRSSRRRVRCTPPQACGSRR